MRVGLISRMDKSGLGQGQTRRIARLLNPDHLMVIDSTPFNGSRQYPGWYGYYDKSIVDGFPTNEQVTDFCKQVDVVITCETFYNREFTMIAKRMGVKTICIANPEFFDWFKPDWDGRVTLPDKVIVPSEWMMDKMKQFNAEYLPTPIFEDEFEKARETNIKRTYRSFLFMNGKTAAADRNGLESLYSALELAKSDFLVTIKAQNDIKKHPDPRIIYDFTNPDDQNDLYEGFDCLIQPRRYGGQTLSMTEALQSAMPVIMTDISPNNKVLPKEWLAPASVKSKLMTRIELDVYDAEPQELANIIDTIDLGLQAKINAYAIGKQYDAETLRPEYERIISSL